MKVLKFPKRIKLLSCVLVLALVTSVFGGLNFGLNSSAAPSVWNGSTDTNWTGSGTESDPYQISNAAEFYGMILKGTDGKSTSADTYFKLTDDIYLNDVSNYESWATSAPKNNWYNSAITNEETGFNGNLDGNYKTVYGLYFANTTSTSAAGLIPVLSTGSTVKNITLSKSYIKNNGYSGGIIGTVISAELSDTDDETVVLGSGAVSNSTVTKENVSFAAVEISGCGVDETVTVNSTSNKHAAGGIVANLGYAAGISYSYSAAKLISTSRVGGIYADSVKDYDKAVIVNCYSVGAYPIPVDKAPNVIRAAFTDFDAGVDTFNEDIKLLPTEFMMGDDAKTYMEGLDWNRFKITNSFPIVVPAGLGETVIDVWDGTYDTNWLGSGTEKDPYLVITPEELAGVMVYGSAGNTTNTTYFSLANDIYLNDPAKFLFGSSGGALTAWSTTEMTSGNFKGVFDGNYHTVYGIYSYGNAIAGLFPKIAAGAIIKNVNVANSVLGSGVSAGAIVGSVDGGNYYSGGDSTNAGFAQVIGCGVEDTVEISAWGTGAAGGIVGRMLYQTNINDCYSLAKISGVSTYLGGIYGDAWDPVKQYTLEYSGISDCYTVGIYPFDSSKAPIGKMDNIYTNVSGSAQTADITVLTTDKMKGENAKTYMPNLDWNKFYVTNGDYPRLIGKAKTAGIWNGTEDMGFSGGDGLTPTTAYQISTAEELYKMICDGGKNIDGTKAYYVLTNDIHLNASNNYTTWATNPPKNNWYNSSAPAFIGELDGNYKTVYGLYSVGSADAGLIQNMAAGATVKNVKISRSYISASRYAGGIVGYLATAGSGSAVISGCGIDETVTVKSVNNSAGGMVGAITVSTNINNCYSLSSNISGGQYAGGLIGDGWGALSGCSVSNCYTVGVQPYSASNTPPAFSNVYTDKTPTVAADKIAYVSNASMKGESAKNSMPALGWNRFIITDSYPVTSKVNNEAGDVWNGTAASEYAAGDGKTEITAYQISTAEQLYKMVVDGGKNTDGTPAHYILVSDIYLNDVSSYTSWGTTAPANNWYNSTINGTPFAGNIDGNGHTVYGLYTSGNDWDSYNGLIQNAAPYAEIANLHIRKSYVGGTYAGSFVGSICGTAGTTDRSKKLRITGCSVDSTVTVTGTSAGGLIGCAQGNIVVENCYFSGKISGTNVGGIYGDCWSSGSNFTHELRHVYSDGCFPIAHSGSTVRSGATRTLLSVYAVGSSSVTLSGVTKVSSQSSIPSSALFSTSWYFNPMGKWLLKNRGFMISDINSDDKLDSTDLAILKDMVLSGTAGNEFSDINKDGKTDLVDYVKLKKKFASATGPEIVDDDGYKLTWSDEFDGGGLDFDKWSYKMYMGEASDFGLKQNRSNSDVIREGDESFLRLKAEKMDDGSYRSTWSVTTGDRMTFLYGYLEIRAKVPTMQGVWPSFWLKSNTRGLNSSYDKGLFSSQLGFQENADYDVEVDVFEVFGDNKIVPNLHKWSTDSYATGGNSVTLNDNEWHTYGLLWTPEKIDILLDGNTFMSYNINDNSQFKYNGSTHSSTMEDYHQPLCIIFNNHLFTPGWISAGNFYTNKLPSGFTEANYDIDYVRLYQKQDSSKLYTVTNR